MKRNLYLNNTPVAEAQEKYMAALAGSLETRYEVIPTEQSLGRVTKEAVFARYSSPMYNCAAMDGIAVITSKTAGADETSPVRLRQNEDYIVVDTGDPVRFPYDAVIMAEDITEAGDGVVIYHAAAPWQHVRPLGEDIVTGEMILPSMHRIRGIDVGVLVSAGIMEVEVIARPSVAVIPTGTEIIEPTDTPEEGDIIDSNSRMISAMIVEAGGEPDRFSPVPDEYDRILQTVSRAVDDHDVVIVNAGSSAGMEDYTVHVLRELGEVIVHGVAVKPGKPVILAIVRGKPVIGLPGYPVSAYIAFENFVTPVIRTLTLQGEADSDVVMAAAACRMVSSLKHREYVRVKLGWVSGNLVAVPLARGAGAAMSLVRADGFAMIEQNQEGVESGEMLPVQLCRSMNEIDHMLVVIGSHDLILDVMADLMQKQFRDSFMSSTHVGSMGGLMALKRRNAHLAPTHLLNEETGEYNVSYIRSIFREKMILIKGVHRIQGIMVKKGNPLGIHGVEDLKRCRYVNRQRGAGTRVLLDYKLKQAGILPEEINGYGREAATHMAVAALVQGDSADAGMGVLSAARAMDLDFIEIGPEEYDFVIYAEDLDHALIRNFLEILTSEEFREKLKELGGYACPEIGRMMEIDPAED